MMQLRELYEVAPAVLQNMACTAVGWRIQRSRYNGSFAERLRQAEVRFRWPHDAVKSYAHECLLTFLHDVGYAAAEFDGMPVLSKDDVRQIAGAQPRRMGSAVRKVHTSGTTGAGMVFFTTREAEQEQWATWWRYRRWHGIDLGTWCGYFGGRSIVPLRQKRSPFWRWNWPGRQLMFSGYHMSPGNLDAYLAQLRRSRPPWLHGYPSLLALLAAHMLDNGSELGYPVRWITTGAENLLPQQKDLIHRAFGIAPRQHYGLAEAVANFSECERGRLHVDEDLAYVEFLPIEEGPVCRIVGTNFTNPAFPLIRYDTGDHAQLAQDQSCGCGRPGRIVATVDGRKEDYVLLKNGARLGRMDHILKDLVRVKEAQIYQWEPGRFTFRVVKGSGYSDEDERLLLAETKQRVGDLADVKVEYVEKIERTARGKLRFVVSEVPEGSIEKLASAPLEAF